jgi:hypothetical protein
MVTAVRRRPASPDLEVEVNDRETTHLNEREPHEPAGDPASRHASAAATVRPLPRWARGLLWPFAVVLPLVALGVELSTRICAEALFDPLPTPLHVVLAAAVPLANLAALLALLRPPTPRVWRFVGFANGLAVGVAAYYTLIFLPLVPISVVFVIAYGLGLLSLSPLVNLVAGLGLWRALRARSPLPRRPWLRPGAGAWGLLASFLVLLAVAAPGAITRFALVGAAEGLGEDRTRALRLLRSLGDRELLLRACYERSGEAGDLVSMLFGSRRVSPEAAREVYYRVTGDPFNSVPPPRLASVRGESLADFWDFEQGGAAVGGVLKGLSLAASRLDGSVDPDAALGYVEWTLELRNDAAVTREARAVVALPPGGVVTRATLWIAGEEREAAFGGRAAVRAAYEKVVRVQQRDPLLVTTAGPDRILVQCFPVPVGGTMKVRIGITTPLLVETAGRARLLLPHFVERNFAVAPELRHALWVDSEAGLTALDDEATAIIPDITARPALVAKPVLVAERSEVASTVRGLLDDSALARRSIVADRRADVMASWANDPLEPAFDVVESLEPVAQSRLGSVVVVLDGSRALAAEAEGLRRVLADRPGGRALEIVLAGDEIVDLEAGDVRAGRFGGGTDNVAALVESWDRVAGERDALVVWVHGPQPVELGRADELMQRCARRPQGPRLVALAAAPGPNRVLDALDGCPWATVAARRGTLADDLRALLAGGTPSGATLVPWLERVPAGTRRDGAEKTSAHLVRLWAREEAERRAVMAPPERGPTDFAVRYSLVTPWSGAVVLETAQQYEAAGLTPGSPQEVPTIPEPSLVVLLVSAAALLALVARPRSRWRAAAS